MLETPNFGVDDTLKLNKNLTKLLFLVVHVFEKIFLKSSFSIKNSILKIIDYGFFIQDFVQGCPLQSWLSVMLRALRNEPQIH